MNNCAVAPPDLLQRFIATPHIFRFRLQNMRVCLETNDPSISNAVRTIAAAPPDADDTAATYLWKIVRDEHAQDDGQEVTIISSGALRTVLRGTQTVITIDMQLREVLAFIAIDVSAEEFATRLVPIILDLSRETLLARGEVPPPQ